MRRQERAEERVFRAVILRHLERGVGVLQKSWCLLVFGTLTDLSRAQTDRSAYHRERREGRAWPGGWSGGGWCRGEATSPTGLILLVFALSSRWGLKQESGLLRIYYSSCGLKISWLGLNINAQFVIWGLCFINRVFLNSSHKVGSVIFWLDFQTAERLKTQTFL